MRRFARRLKHLQLRREARARHGRRLDLQATIRRSVASGGTPFHLAWKDRRRVRPRLVLLIDVSRSMALYSFFYLRLARALSAELADVHSFIFHTRVTAVSQALHDPDPWRAQERLHLIAQGWAGGTRIGESLAQFNREHAARAGAFAHRRHRRSATATTPAIRSAVRGAGAAAAPRAPPRLAQPAAATSPATRRSARACRPRCRTWTCWRRAATWRASRRCCRTDRALR